MPNYTSDQTVEYLQIIMNTIHFSRTPEVGIRVNDLVELTGIPSHTIRRIIGDRFKLLFVRNDNAYWRLSGRLPTTIPNLRFPDKKLASPNRFKHSSQAKSKKVPYRFVEPFLRKLEGDQDLLQALYQKEPLSTDIKEASRNKLYWEYTNRQAANRLAAALLSADNPLEAAQAIISGQGLELDYLVALTIAGRNGTEPPKR